MTETLATTATQAEIDADTYAAFTRNGENKSAAGRELGIGTSTVSDRVKRHLARLAQDEAAAGDAAQDEDETVEPEGEQAPGAPEATEAGDVPAAAPAAEAGDHDHGDRDHEGDAPAAEAGDEKPAKDYVTECVDCGFKFSRPQARRTCQSAKACQKRQDARAAAAAAE
jgi:hypothetical protein